MTGSGDRFDKRISASLLLIGIAIGTSSLAFTLDARHSNVYDLSLTANSATIWLNGDAVGVHPGWNDSSPGPTMTVMSGVTVHLFLNSTDNLAHRWFIDTLGNSQPDPNGITSPDFSVSTTGPLEFTFTPKIGQNIPSAGNWTYKCYYHPFSMYGQIRVIPPDFSLSASPSSITTTVGTTAMSTVTVSLLSTFTGTVSLSTTAPSNLHATVSPTTISGASGTATLSLTPLTAGNYTATVTGTSTSLSQSLNITIIAEDFTISADPTVVAAKINTANFSTITVSQINNFAGTVDLASNSTLCNLSPPMLIGSGVSTLSCTFTSQGRFSVQVTATNASLSHTISITFDVAIPDYQVLANPVKITTLAGQAGNSTISIEPINGFSGLVTLTTSSPSPGLECDLNRISIASGSGQTATLSCKGAGGTAIVVVATTSGGTSRFVSLTYTIEDFTMTPITNSIAIDANTTSSSALAITPLNGFAYSISISATGSAGLTSSIAPATLPKGTGVAFLTFNAKSPGNYTTTVTATGLTLSHTVVLDIQVQDFTILENKASGVAVGQTKTTIEILPVNHFQGRVLLTTNSTYCISAPSEADPLSNVTIECTFPVSGVFHVSVTAENGSLSHKLTINYTATGIQQTSGNNLPYWLAIVAVISTAIVIAAVLSYAIEMRRRR